MHQVLLRLHMEVGEPHHNGVVAVYYLNVVVDDPAGVGNPLTTDHVIPRSRGGTSNWGNLVCACVKCNVKKGGRTPDEAHLSLIRPPVKPRRNPVVSIKLSDHRYRSWKQFLDAAYWDVELT